MTRKHVLVTGGSGFIAGHCILQLIEQGHRVRATLRSLDREGDVRAVLHDAGLQDDTALGFVAADLMRDDGWAGAMSGIDVVLHVASPVQPGHVEDENQLIAPAVDGTLRVLRTARDAGVGRVVLTSAFHAVSWGYRRDGRVFNDDDWTILDGPGVDAYGKSKTLAERAAWDFIASEGGTLELTSLLPVAVMGPVMGRDISGSNHIIQRLLTGAVPGLPNLYIPIVDVRDVAAAHVSAMTAPQAAGQRFLISNGVPLSMKQIADTLREALGASAERVPTRTIPDLVLRLSAVFNRQVRSYVADLGYVKKTTNDKARRLLGWTPRPPREAIIAAGDSMVRKGLIPDG